MEEIFGWMKTVGGFRRTRYRGVERTGLAGYFVATAYNLVRMADLMSCQQPGSVQAGVSCPGCDAPKMVLRAPVNSFEFSPAAAVTRRR